MSLKALRRNDATGNQLIANRLKTGNLAQGANETSVKWMERMLEIAGFKPGKRDNSFDGATAKALREFQQARGLPVTGELDAKTFAALKDVQKRVRDNHGKPFFGAGQKGTAVQTAEKQLRKLGYDVGKVDGIFDGQLAKAVTEFKKDQKNLGGNSMLGKASLRERKKEVDAFAHAPYRGRVTKEHKAHKRLDALTQTEAAKKNSEGLTGIGAGSSKRAIANVQAHLRRAGFDPKRTDGVFDERTEAALEAFQRKAKLPETGRVGPGTWKKLAATTFLAKSGTSPAQRLGEKSQAVLNTEKLMRKLGYKSVKADGIFDKATQAASRKFEKRFPGMGDDGRIGAGQLKRMKQVLRAKEHPGSGPTLKKGYKGAPVKRLQQRLEKMGFDVGKVDGVFGEGTRKAVIRFERAFGLKADGVVGKGTWKYLAIRAHGKVIKPGAGGAIRAGGGWGGSEGVADAAKSIARSMGIPVTSTKRNLADTIRVGSSTGSDHYTGNTSAYAVDFGVAGSRGDALAQALCRKYGIPTSAIGTFNRYTITVDGKRYSLQLLWKVSGHYDHVHLGIRRA